MICPYCQTDNRDDREACYYCKKDLSMLRLIVNKAKHHYNQGLEYAERGRLDDAIGELRNALDLDGTMDNAHVVLGTLYAKKENFEEARKCWDRALALNHNLSKAHEYLYKAEKAEYVFPALKRLKVLTYALGGALGLAVVLLLTVTVVSSGRKTALHNARKSMSGDIEKIQKAMADLEEPGNTGRVLTELEKTSQEKTGTPAGTLADELAQRIKEDWQRRLAMATASIKVNNFPTALQILDSIRAENPSPEVQNSVDRLTATAQEYALRWINESAGYFFSGNLPYERFSVEARRYIDYLGDPKAKESVLALKAKVDKANDERTLNEVMETVANGPVVKAVDAVAQWTIQHPDTATSLQQALEQRLNLENSSASAEVRSLAEREQFERAAARIEELRLLYKSIRRPAPEKLIATLDAQIRDNRRKAEFDQAVDLFKDKDWEKFLERTADLNTLSATAEETAQLTAMRQEAAENQAREALAFFRERDAAFKDGNITAEDAIRAVKAFPVALPHVAREATLSTATLLYDAAAAHAKLDQPDKALELLKPIAVKYPKAVVARSAARLQKKIEDAQAKKNGAPPASGNGAASPSTTKTEPVKAEPAKTAPAKTETAKPVQAAGAPKGKKKKSQ